MSWTRNSTRRRWLPAYQRNALLQLVVISGVAYIAYHGIKVTLWMSTRNADSIFGDVQSQLMLPVLEQFPQRFWTLLTYGWLHHGFWELFTNMIWLYCFGSVVQTLVGFRQIIPIYFYGLILGGLFYEAIQLLPAVHHSFPIIGGQAGIMALALAALTVSPGFRFYIADRFSIPLVVVAIIFFVLMVMNTDMRPAPLALLVGGALMGHVYIRLLHKGFRPGAWIYQVVDYFDALFQPKPGSGTSTGKRRRSLASSPPTEEESFQQQVDEILDKIHLKGYQSLTKEEKQLLIRASTMEDLSK